MEAQVKVEHRKPKGMTQEINIPTWNWEVIDMNFNKGVTPKKFTLQIRTICLKYMILNKVM